MVIEKRGFVKGLKLKERKLSSDCPIIDFPVPERVIIPLQQHAGAPCIPAIKKGDMVSEGQLIGDSPAAISAKVHASISGKVTNISRIVNPASNTIVGAVEIISEKEKEDNANGKVMDNGKTFSRENDRIRKKTDDQRLYRSTSGNIKDAPERFREVSGKTIGLSPEEMIARIKDAGVVGLGGAAFPTHVKLAVPESKKIDTVIINGCECEPYITADHRLMLEYGFEVIMGAYLINRILKPKDVYIAIEDNKRDAIEHVDRMIKAMSLDRIINVFSLPSRYPMGAEKTLIKNILKRKVPAGGLPMDVGVVVNNTGTARAIFDAIVYERPLIERVITVTGDIEKPCNLNIRIGTLIGDLYSYFGRIGYIPEDQNREDDRADKGTENIAEKMQKRKIFQKSKTKKENTGSGREAYKIIFGGPMTGFSVVNMDFPVTKGLNCILVKKEREIVPERECIRCGRCIDVCPMNLMPLMYARFVKRNRYQDCRDYYIDSCIECGCCAYACPASIPLVGYIRTGKAALARK